MSQDRLKKLETLYLTDIALEMAKLRHRLAVQKRKFGNRAALAENVKVAESNRLTAIHALRNYTDAQET